MMIWSKGMLDGYEVWTGRTVVMEMAVVPKLGCRVISLRNRRTGREWLVRPVGGLETNEYASSFGKRDGAAGTKCFLQSMSAGIPRIHGKERSFRIMARSGPFHGRRTARKNSFTAACRESEFLISREKPTSSP